MSAASNKPKYLNLFRIRLPLPGLVSILHRISGFGLFVLMGLILWVFQLSLQSEAEFEFVISLTRLWIVKLLVTGLVWAFVHHFFAGIRFLLLDLHWGADIFSARVSGILVMAVSIASTLCFALIIW